MPCRRRRRPRQGPRPVHDPSEHAAKLRNHSRAQRLAFTITQGGCITEDCEMPAWLCEAHHPLPWTTGGETNKDDVWLCPHHHRRAHDARYEMTHHPEGTVSFHRRT